MYADAHCHWTSPKVMSDLDSELKRCLEQGISLFGLGGLDPMEWEIQKELKAKYPLNFLTSFGLHPYFVSGHSDEECETALDLLSQLIHNCDSVGELGLDFRSSVTLDNEDHQIRQIDFFVNQLELAQAFSKPVVLHIVRAHEKALEILDLFGTDSLKGIVHAYSGSFETAERYIKKGLLISIGGAVTFSKNKKVRQAVYKIPLEHLVIESDAPDQAPSSLSVINVAKEIGLIKNIPFEQVLESTARQFKKLYSV